MNGSSEKRMTIASRGSTGVAATLAMCAVLAAAAPASKPDASMIGSTDWLAKNLSNRSVVVLVVDRTDSVYRAGHVPGARFIPYAAYGQTIDGIQLELPSPDSLRALFESAGRTTATHVIFTGRPLIVTWAFYTLAYCAANMRTPSSGRFRDAASAARQSCRCRPMSSRFRFDGSPITYTSWHV